MDQKPRLLYLHGVTPEPSNLWQQPLNDGLIALGYQGLDQVEVIAPGYAHALKGADDKEPLPPMRIVRLKGEAAARNRREYELRVAALDSILHSHRRGDGRAEASLLIGAAVDIPHFVQAKRYVNDPAVRAQVLKKVLKSLPDSGPLVILGHSLGSVIAADLIRRLPPEVNITGLITIGSPLGHARLRPDRLTDDLRDPPINMAWWVNFWNQSDPVVWRTSVSTAIPWVLDEYEQVPLLPSPEAHAAETYLTSAQAAAAIGYGLFGSRSKALAVVEHSLDIPLDPPQTLALLALHYAHLVKELLPDGAKRERYAGALRQVQATMVAGFTQRATDEGGLLPPQITALSFDAENPDSAVPRPTPLTHLGATEAVIPLITIGFTNVVRPYEIEVGREIRSEAFSRLAAEMRLSDEFGKDASWALETAHQVIKGGGTNWLKWLALGAGAAALVVGTGGLALAAAPGLGGAAAITSALAAFGPGGMVGGLLTAGSLVGAGGGGIALGLASPTTTAAAVEATVEARLAAALLRKRHGIPQDPDLWWGLAQMRDAVARELASRQPFSDDAAPSIKELERKREAIKRALDYMEKERLGVEPMPLDD